MTSILDIPSCEWHSHLTTAVQGLRDSDTWAPYRVSQLRNWLFARKTDAFQHMVSLPQSLRDTLAGALGPSIFTGICETEVVSADTTEKLLIRFPDGEGVECVLLRDDQGHRTGCISTQVGCAMGCAFCASGMDGFVRNLRRGEMLEQILRLNQRLSPAEGRLRNLVVMGTGEPLLNLEPLLGALEEVTTPSGLDMSARRITISTVGIPQGILALADSGKPYKLAVSLHAPNDTLRTRLVPQNRHHSIAAILAATDTFFAKTGRRVTFEYVLLKGINDQPSLAKELAILLRNRTAIVNIIPFNPVPELPYQTPSSNTVHTFVQTLKSSGMDVKIRFRKGDRIDAACGQLRRRMM